MQGSESRLADILSSPDGRRAFLDWISSPLTQELLGVAEESVKPADVPTISAEQALFQLGVTVGGQRVLDRMRNPLFAHELRDKVRKLDVAPSYGSDDILKREGRDVTRKEGKEQ